MEIFIAAIVSVVVQGVKKIFKTSIFGTTLTLLILSLFAGWAIVALQNAGYWESVIQIGAMSAGVWALILKRFEA